MTVIRERIPPRFDLLAAEAGLPTESLLGRRDQEPLDRTTACGLFQLGEHEIRLVVLRRGRGGIVQLLSRTYDNLSGARTALIGLSDMARQGRLVVGLRNLSMRV